MSKAKSTDPVVAHDAEESVEERIIGVLWRWFPVGIALGTVGAGTLLGPGFGVLVLAAGAFIGAIAAMWASVRSFFGETPLVGEDAFAIGSPSVEEEQKRALLRAIKDVEFEHNVGKISDEDYRTLIASLRAEAKDLLRRSDELAAPSRAKAEKLAAEHLSRRGIAVAKHVTEDVAKDAPKGRDEAKPKNEKPAPVAEIDDEDSDEDGLEDGDRVKPADEDEDDVEDEEDQDDDVEADDEEEDDDVDEDDDEDDEDEERSARVKCPECGSSNEADAAFCKKCATALETTGEEVDA